MFKSKTPGVHLFSAGNLRYVHYDHHRHLCVFLAADLGQCFFFFFYYGEGGLIMPREQATKTHSKRLDFITLTLQCAMSCLHASSPHGEATHLSFEVLQHSGGRAALSTFVFYMKGSLKIKPVHDLLLWSLWPTRVLDVRTASVGRGQAFV